MKKVFIIHGFEGSPNGGWRPWLMAELEKLDIYACALAMPCPENPQCGEWVSEISRHVESNSSDEICLVGHSLGVPAILRYLETVTEKAIIKGIVLVSGPAEKNNNHKIANFFETSFNFQDVRSKIKNIIVIHGDNDPFVPLVNGQFLAQELNADLITICGGKHLNGSSGCFTLPECLDVLKKMFTN